MKTEYRRYSLSESPIYLSRHIQGQSFREIICKKVPARNGFTPADHKFSNSKRFQSISLQADGKIIKELSAKCFQTPQDHIHST
jgi:hypothetical protein